MRLFGIEKCSLEYQNYTSNEQLSVTAQTASMPFARFTGEFSGPVGIGGHAGAKIPAPWSQP